MKSMVLLEDLPRGIKGLLILKTESRRGVWESYWRVGYGGFRLDNVRKRGDERERDKEPRSHTDAIRRLKKGEYPYGWIGSYTLQEFETKETMGFDEMREFMQKIEGMTGLSSRW